MIGDDSTTCDVALRHRSAPGRCRRCAQPATASRAERRRIEQGDELGVVERPAGCARRRATGPSRRPALGTRRRASRCCSRPSTVSLTSARGPVGPRRRHLDQAVDPLAPAHRPTDDSAVRDRSAARCSSPASRTRGTSSGSSVTGSSGSDGDVELVLDRLVPGHPLRAVDGEPPRPAERPVGLRRLDGPVLDLQAADAHSRRGRHRPGRPRTSVRIDERSEPVGRGVGRRRQHAELPAQLVLPAPTPGTGTGRSPRTAPRRPPCGRRRRIARRRRPTAVTRRPPRPP